MSSRARNAAIRGHACDAGVTTTSLRRHLPNGRVGRPQSIFQRLRTVDILHVLAALVLY